MNVEEILQAAVEMKSPAERDAYLDAACGNDAALRAQVDGLLRAYVDAGSFLQRPLFEASPTVDLPPSPEKPGTMIGQYKLLQQIGEGGMGTVFMAEQTEPVKRKVALKLIKPGMDSRQVIARFEAERQALAMMDHVNIARVFDGGATESGRPYFVMELVHGVPITKYCDDNHLTPRQRLELFVPVCQAIQHAHQKGIIHRDIKPSNVMVTLYDGKPVPKVIDFGVAKATEQKLTERTLFTQYGTMVGTLEYMSPEQAEMSALGVDTRSDIYSLGVLLYELLTGSTPLTPKRMKEAAYGEILRMIKEEEPPKPSTRLSELGEALASISAQRKTEPAKLTKLVRGELDWIVMKTLEKDRNRRYETANGFAADVQRYLADEPVQACPPSSGYRLRKFVRRNKVALGTGLVVSLAMVLAVVVLAVTNLWVAQERDEKADALKDREAALQEKEGALALAKASAQAAQKSETAAKAQEKRALENAAKTDAERKRAESHFLKSRILIRETLTNAVGGQGPWKELTPAFRKHLAEECLKFYQGFVNESATDPTLRYETGWAYQAIALMHGLARDHEQQEKFLRLAVAALDPLVAEFPAVDEYTNQLAWTNVGLGRRLMATRRLAEAEQSFRRATELYDALQTRADRTLAFEDEAIQARQGLISVLQAAGRPDELGKAYARQVEHLEKLAAAGPKDRAVRHGLANAYDNLAEVWATTGRGKDAQELRWRACAILEALVEEDPRTVNYRWWLARTYRELGRHDQALAQLDQALKQAPKEGWLWNLRGVVHYDQKRFDQAAADFTKSLELLPQDAIIWANQARTYMWLGQLDRAVADATRALELRPDYADALEVRAQAYSRLRDWNKVVADLTRILDQEPKNTSALRSRGQAFLLEARRQQAAADVLRSAGLPCRAPHVSAIAVTLEHQSRAQTVQAAADFTALSQLTSRPAHDRELLIALEYVHLKEFDQAIRHYTTAIGLKPDLAFAWHGRGLAYSKLRQFDKAATDYSKAIDLGPGDNFQVLFRVDRAEVFAEMGKWSAAAADLRQACELDPKGALFSEATYKRALVSLAVGDREGHRSQCAALLKRSDEQLRTSPAAYNAALAAVLVPDAVADQSRPVRLARELASRDPKSYTYARLLGAALLRAGNAEEAVKELTRATTLQEKSPATWLLLALAHHRLGQAEEARRRFTTAAEDLDRRSASDFARMAWHERLLVKHLRGEAETTLGIKGKTD